MVVEVELPTHVFLVLLDLLPELGLLLLLGVLRLLLALVVVVEVLKVNARLAEAVRLDLAIDVLVELTHLILFIPLS